MVKYFGAKTLTKDRELFDPDTGEPPRCASSDLNEELGQVEHLFCDKTGTLTENELVFRSCTINGQIFVESDGKLLHNGQSIHVTVSQVCCVSYSMLLLIMVSYLLITANDRQLFRRLGIV